jgi:AcrR family transcriptional regulator
MGKAEQNKQNKRASLLQAAFDLFLNQGFHDTTISDISKKSGLAKGTFYLYFKDKYDLRDQLIARKSEQLLVEASEYTKTSLPEQAGFEEYLLSMIDYILHHLQNNKMLLRFISKNLSWGIFKHAVEREEEQTVLGTVYADYLQILDRDHISCSNPELMLFTILELVSSTSYNCIIYESPADLETYLPYLHSCIHQIIEAFSA